MSQLSSKTLTMDANRITWPIRRGFFAVYICLMALKSYHRCTEWSTEKLLFESALDVCPQSLKVLNNYAQLFLKTDPQHALPFLGEYFLFHLCLEFSFD